MALGCRTAAVHVGASRLRVSNPNLTITAQGFGLHKTIHATPAVHALQRVQEASWRLDAGGREQDVTPAGTRQLVHDTHLGPVCGAEK
jgi:hypothetical protein